MGVRRERGMRLCACAAWLLLLVGVRAATDFSGETEFPSSAPSKYPDTRSVAPHQPVRQRARSRCSTCEAAYSALLFSLALCLALLTPPLLALGSAVVVTVLPLLLLRRLLCLLLLLLAPTVKFKPAGDRHKLVLHGTRVPHVTARV